MKKISFLFLLLLSFRGYSQIITTIAGNGIAGYVGDGLAAPAAELNGATEVVTDALGNIYIADWKNNCIRKINTSNVITTVAGNGTAGYGGDGLAATLAELNNPTGVFVDGTGNIYIGDYQNNRVRKVDTSGIITTIAGNGIPGYSGDGFAATAAELNWPSGISVDASGNVYFAESVNSIIRRVDTSGVISTIAGTGADGFSGDGSAATTAELYHPYGIFRDKSGNLYIADQSNNRVRKIDTAGIISTIAGNGLTGYSGDGTAATLATLNIPSSLYVDDSGNILITDRSNSAVRKVNTSGIITTIAGTGAAGFSGDGGPATAAELNNPCGVCVTTAGTILIADVYNNRIRKISHSTTGIKDIPSRSETIKVYPNPASSMLTITSTGNVRSVSFTNLLGQTVYTREFNADWVQVDIAAFPSGVYFVKINGTTVSKFVKL